MNIHTYFLVKERFSRLVFADKYEVIFKEAYVKQDVFSPQKALEKLNRILEEKSKSSKIDRGKAQREILANYQEHKDKYIFVLEAPTGIGKTFAALQLALTIACDKNKSKIITALPFTSIIEQTHREYAKVIDERTLLKYHHLTPQKTYEVDGEEEQKLQKNDYLSSTWALDSVVVTAFNQLFYAIFSNKNRDLTKFWVLRDSIVILDEVQAIPRFLLKDITKILVYLARHFNIHFILMSATIPAIKGVLREEDSEIWTDKLLDPQEYYSQNKRYKITLNRAIDSEEKLVRRVAYYAPSHSVLCVVNTKRFAKSVYDNVKSKLIAQGYCKEDVYLLTTHLTPFHRRCMIREIRRKLKCKKIVLISTQMVEAGVDVDFDLGFREFAPFGSIIQTAGRINRENSKGVCRLFVFDIPGRKSPYDIKDMLKEEVMQYILNKPLFEADILERIRTYFDIASERTGESGLLRRMEALEFESAFQTFNEHFMKKIPNLTSVFIEARQGLWTEYRMGKEALLQSYQEATSLEEKFNIKLKLKQIEKKISRFIIDVRSDETSQLPLFMDSKRYLDFTELKVCEFSRVKESGQYHAREGWNGEYWDYGFE
jgi:CRISPR-associated endonuclease/helicase Cas3